jgi:hypothetical protein
VSTHLTIGVHPWTRGHLADELVRVALDRAADDPRVRGSLPLGVDVGDPDAWAADLEVVRAALRRAVDEVAPGDLAGALARRARDSQRAGPVRPLAQVHAAARLSGGQRLDLRPHLAARLGPVHDGYAVLDSRAGTLRVAGADLERVRHLLDHGDAAVADLGDVLARQLLLAGIVVAR